MCNKSVEQRGCRVQPLFPLGRLGSGYVKDTGGHTE